jgi:hypothetical protein
VRTRLFAADSWVSVWRSECSVAIRSSLRRFRLAISCCSLETS